MVIKHKNFLVDYLKKKHITKDPDQIMTEIQSFHNYYLLHLQEATGVQQQIGMNMM